VLANLILHSCLFWNCISYSDFCLWFSTNYYKYAYCIAVGGFSPAVERVKARLSVLLSMGFDLVCLNANEVNHGSFSVVVHVVVVFFPLQFFPFCWFTVTRQKPWFLEVCTLMINRRLGRTKNMNKMKLKLKKDSGIGINLCQVDITLLLSPLFQIIEMLIIR
jgi:hypothetical protein